MIKVYILNKSNDISSYIPDSSVLELTLSNGDIHDHILLHNAPVTSDRSAILVHLGSL